MQSDASNTLRPSRQPSRLRRWFTGKKCTNNDEYTYDGRYDGRKIIVKKFADDDDDVLFLPGFEIDAIKLAEGNPSKHMKDDIIDDLIDARIESLSGLFRPRHSKLWPHERPQTLKQRATDMTDEQLVDWVLRGACNENNLQSKEHTSSIDGVSFYIHDETASSTDDLKNDESPSTATDHVDAADAASIMKQIFQRYQSRREEIRVMAKSYFKSPRNITEFDAIDRVFLDGAFMPLEFPNENVQLPLLPPRDRGRGQNRDGNNDAPRSNSIHIDLHGRLVRERREPLNAHNEGGAESENTNDANENGSEVDDLVDATETFRKHKLIAEDRLRDKMNGVVREGSFRPNRQNVSTPQSYAHQHALQHNPPFPVAPMQPLRMNEVRNHNISQEMERDSIQAIERALGRYIMEEERSSIRRHTPHSNRNDRISLFDTAEVSDNQEQAASFEIIHIPLVRQLNQENESRLSRYLPFSNRRQRQARAGNERRNGAAVNGAALRGDFAIHPQHAQNDNNVGGWPDARLAFRRICFAVMAVVAAFICIMLQELTFDFRDDTVYIDGMEVDSVWLSGLMGPHFSGHHFNSRVSSHGMNAAVGDRDVSFNIESANDEEAQFAAFWAEHFGSTSADANSDSNPQNLDQDWIDLWAKLFDDNAGAAPTVDFSDWEKIISPIISRRMINEDSNMESCEGTEDFSPVVSRSS